jgi:nicotinamidase/pyrazinamidase
MSPSNRRAFLATALASAATHSAFYEADAKTPTGLAGYLKERGLERVFLVGLATDFCVGVKRIKSTDIEGEVPGKACA